MKYISVDIEADGPIPGDYSMVCFGAVIIENGLKRTFYGELKPISDKYIPEALAVSGFPREKTMEFDDPAEVMQKFADWLDENVNGRPMFISDNNGFDWQFINWYFHHFIGRNPFGHSSMNLGSFAKGLFKDTRKNHKRFRRTKHDHNPVNDAKGNAEALMTLAEKFHLNMRF